MFAVDHSASLQPTPLRDHVLLVGALSPDEAAAYASSLHLGSALDREPFLQLLWDGFPDLLVESALFGHEQGSFAGAFRDHVGLLQRAARGTLYIDRIDRLSPATATRLERALARGRAYRIGQRSGDYLVTTRVISAVPQLPDRRDHPALAALCDRFRVVSVD